MWFLPTPTVARIFIVVLRVVVVITIKSALLPAAAAAVVDSDRLLYYRFDVLAVLDIRCYKRTKM